MHHLQIAAPTTNYWMEKDLDPSEATNNTFSMIFANGRRWKSKASIRNTVIRRSFCFPAKRIRRSHTRWGVMTTLLSSSRWRRPGNNKQEDLVLINLVGSLPEVRVGGGRGQDVTLLCRHLDLNHIVPGLACST